MNCVILCTPTGVGSVIFILCFLFNIFVFSGGQGFHYTLIFEERGVLLNFKNTEVKQPEWRWPGYLTSLNKYAYMLR